MKVAFAWMSTKISHISRTKTERTEEKSREAEEGEIRGN